MTSKERNELIVALGRADHFRRDTAMLFLSLDRIQLITRNLQRCIGSDIARSSDVEVNDG